MFDRNPTLTRSEFATFRNWTEVWMLANEHVHMSVMRGGVRSPHPFTCTSYLLSLLNKHAVIHLSVAKPQNRTSKSHIESKQGHKDHELQTTIYLDTCCTRIDKPNQATTMNRLFGAKNNAPKPTLTSAISNVTPPQTLASLALSKPSF